MDGHVPWRPRRAAARLAHAVKVVAVDREIVEWLERREQIRSKRMRHASGQRMW